MSVKKSFYKVLKTIGYSGERYNQGDVVEMDDDTARAFGADYVELTDAPATAGVNVESEASVQTTKKKKKRAGKK
jgi:hypothetical protein